MNGIFVVFWLCLISSAASAFTADRPMEVLTQTIPEAESLGERLTAPPVYPAYKEGRIVGYAFFSTDIVQSAGYSAKPVNVAIGLDLDARITGVRLVEHHEPILVLGITEADFQAFLDQYRGLRVTEPVKLHTVVEGAGQGVDGVSGATVSSLSFNGLITGSSRIVADSLRLGQGTGATPTRFRAEPFAPARWDELRGDGSIAQLPVSIGAVRNALQGQGAALLPGLDGSPDGNFITLDVALVNPARIGRNLLGDRAYTDLTNDLPPGGSVLFLGSTGLFSFKGTSWHRSGLFDRFQIVQGTRTFRLTAAQHRTIDKIPLAGAPAYRETGLFVLAPDSGFDPTAPWRVDLLVESQGVGNAPVFASFALPYTLPDRYLPERPSAAVAPQTLLPDWQEVWWSQRGLIGVLCLILLTLTGILFFQDQLAERPLWHRRVRVAMLTVTLVWIGWYATAQLSIINVLTFANALLSGFDWNFFLLDPLLFILWSYVAIALLFWGRGVFCGWLCPFGALQELVNRGARAIGIKQYRLPWSLNERLWPLKYIVFIALFAISLNSMERATVGVEVEPFKTAITLRFLRDWPWVLYAGGLLVASLFIERFFCRYLCPLGAALAIPARIRMFQWLKRHPQCGRECRICEQRCPVQAIHPSGEINPNECIYCLKCQTLYFDTHTCPPMIVRRKRREARVAGQKEVETKPR